MKKVILDTNFILSCVRQRIDFFEDIKFRGLKILIPTGVINELKKLKNSGKKLHLRNNADLALKILERSNFESVDLSLENVDDGLIDFINKNPEVILATLDRELKRKTKKPKLVIRGKKKLEII
ncbi:hypothetical protein K0A97_02235 [Patescibacteria group bacterium]|nr:hypothetical protein [Patescibacteria group bacterium]